MRYRSIHSVITWGWLTVIFAVAYPATSQASDIVLQGWDLLETPGEKFGSTPENALLQNTLLQLSLSPFSLSQFIGVPIESFDFPGIGIKNTGSADTIVRRLNDVDDLPDTPETDSTAIQMDARRLRTQSQVDFGLGTDFYFLTLQSERGGPASTGSLTVAFGPDHQGTHGTFDWEISMAFDIRKGSPTGSIAMSDTLLLTATRVPWSHFPPSMAVLIPGVNFMLNGTDQESDFWPIGLFDGGLTPAVMPVPTTIVLVGTGLAGIAGVSRRRNRSQTA